MKSNPDGWFEIYVQDMPRAKAFYEAVFQGALQELKNPDPQGFPDMEMWAFPRSREGYGAPGALVQMKGCPSGGSTLVYFSCEDCSIEAERAASGRNSPPALRPPWNMLSPSCALSIAERELWRAVKAGRFAGFKFRRQHPVGTYFLDCYCPMARLAVELDGTGVSVNALAPFSVVRTPGADMVGTAQYRNMPGWKEEPAEAMAEAALALFAGDPAVVTGLVVYSTEYLEKIGRKIHTLDGRSELVGWKPAVD